MARHNELGAEGEAKAVIYLSGKGYKILECNYRYGRSQIDIIAMDKKMLVFVEVKTRTNYVFGFPEESVSKKKMKLMVSAASNYLFENNLACECRFDILAIFKSKDEKWFFKHFEDAFFLIED